MENQTAMRSLLPDREIGICLRLREAREAAKRRQADFAKELGVSRVRLASYEYAKSPLRYELAIRACYLLDINQRWLATGQLPVGKYFEIDPNLEHNVNRRSLFSKAFDDVLAAEIERRFRRLCELLGEDVVLTDSFDSAILDTLPRVGAPPIKSAAFDTRYVLELYLHWLPDELLSDYAETLLDAHQAFVREHRAKIKRYADERARKRKSEAAAKSTNPKNPLTAVTADGNNPTAMQTLSVLLQRLNKATAARGMKSKLAKYMGVPLPNVSQWLSGEREPSGETTLRLLHWVEQQERKT